MRFRDKVKAWQGEVLLGWLWLFKLIASPLGLQRVYSSLIESLINRRGIFDRSYYLKVNHDVVEAEMSPLRHYVRYGDKEGRSPMPFFDPNYYRSHTQGRFKDVNTLLHYTFIGRYRRISTSPWFDVDYYLSNNKDIARSQIDPLLHYLKWGGFEGRSPCQQFDSSYYLRRYPDVVEMHINPLLHYLFYGRKEARKTLPQQEVTAALSDDLPWYVLQPRANIAQADVDVIVPVFKGRAETLHCLYSVLAASCQTLFELIVIDDGSPDRALVEDLQRLASQGLFTLHTNTINRGFVHTINNGIALHRHRNVVLLNSDTEVYSGWLDRLNKAAHRDSRTGTVTPLSNNATICSYPSFLHDNPYPLELGYAELDEIAARQNTNLEVEAPTGVGFCMYIKRSCLDAIGVFDEKAFGKGYGEENDFCQRAIENGWRNIIAADTFVRHLGSTSFQGERAKRVQNALKIIDKRYPRYRKDVDDFIRRDPLKNARHCLDWARMLRMRKEKNILIVSHNRGGGSERCVQEEIQRLTAQGMGVFLLRPMRKNPTQVTIGHPAIRSFPNLKPFGLADVTSLKAALSELRITEVHTHSLVDFVPEAPIHLNELIKKLGVQWKIYLHDYKVICPRINLIDEKGFYCGEPPEEGCNQCLMERGSDFNITDIHIWRAHHKQALLAANKVVVPDQDIAERLQRYFPEVDFEVTPHEAIDPVSVQILKPQIMPNEKLRVVILGAISHIKGFHVIISCAKHVRKNNLPIEFIILGYSMNDKLMEKAGVQITGKYQEHEALEKLKKLNPHVVWLPSTWPETYSYTLSLAIKAHLPVFAFDIGAIARRCKEYGMEDLLMPLQWASIPANITQKFEQFRVFCRHLDS